MISSVDSQLYGPTQMFFKNRFPEPKDAPLLDLENSKTSNDDSSTSASQQQYGIEQANFTQALQNAALSQKSSKDENTVEGQNRKVPHNKQNELGDREAYEHLRIKAQYNALFQF